MASYPPKKFSNTDLPQALEIAEATKFATLVHAGDAGLITCHLPMTVVWEAETVSFVGHIVRSNPLYDVLSGGAVNARLIFQPAQGYVSPSLYGEKAVTGKVVPTWNYVAAHFDGVAELCADEQALMETLNRQTQDYERAHGGDWKVDDAPDAYIASLLKAIAGISFRVETSVNIQKLSQNKPDDIPRISQWLEDTQPTGASIAHWMKRFHNV